MKYIDEFRNNRLARKISNVIFDKANDLQAPIKLMEVCGTHTMSICKFGIRSMLPENIELISGPGCPVCVSPVSYIDTAIALAKFDRNIIVTFGDMMKLPGSYSTLEKERASGGLVKVVYSSLDALDIAKENSNKSVIFLGIGFETTAPTSAVSLLDAKKSRLKNFFVYSGHKIILPAMEALVNDREVNIDGFICPAHVSAIIGTKPYNKITKGYNVPCVITGFEPLDILQGILMLLIQIKANISKVENQYKRVVKFSGNKKAISLVEEVFSIVDSEWRGLGIIPKSGLRLRKRYHMFDAERNFNLSEFKIKKDTSNCICGDVLKGIAAPPDCPLFGKRCIPERPIGPCMVSSEGTCSAHYKYRLKGNK